MSVLFPIYTFTCMSVTSPCILGTRFQREYDLGFFSRTALDFSGCIVTRSCFACLLTTIVIIRSSFSH